MTKEPKSWFADFVNKTLKGKKPVESVQPTSEEERRAVLEREKEEATKAGKSWVAVLDTQINPENIKNGFFELDWNNQFIEELLEESSAHNCFIFHNLIPADERVHTRCRASEIKILVCARQRTAFHSACYM